MKSFSFFILLLAAVCAGMAAHAELMIPEDPQWIPVKDEVYLQETSRPIPSDTPLVAVAVFDHTVYASRDGVLVRLEGDALVPVESPVSGVVSLKTVQNRLWALTAYGLWRMEGAGWVHITPKPIQDLCEFNGITVALSEGRLYRLDDDRGLVADPVLGDASNRPLRHAAPYAGTVYVAHAGGIGAVYQGELQFEYLADWGTLQQGCTVRDMLSWGSRLVLATDEGLALLRGMTWYPIHGEDGLCVEDTTCLAHGFAHDLWIGTERGAIRWVNDDFQYFGEQRWLPDNHVNAIAVEDNAVYIATDGGLGIIEYEPYTLRKKSDWYENWLEEWGMKRLGFTHLLMWENGQWVREVSDNDVGYSSHYFDALCFKYAVTKDPAVKAEAVEMMKSMKWSEEITSIDGFPARSIWAVGEEGHQAQHGSGGLPAEWHETPDGKWQWKGDTSSDETDAHMYATSLFLELVAETEDERAMAVDHLRRVVGHIVDNGFVLRDVDGQPTRWARWDPEYLQRPYGFYARGLNGMEVLSYTTNAYHFTHDEKFKAAKQQLIDWGYSNEVLRQKLTFHPGFFTPFDDRLAFYAYFPLLRYEPSAMLRGMWRMSLERSWEVKRIDGVPWFNFIYGAITGNDCENDRSVAHLREWPLDLHSYAFRNSHRDDLFTPKGYRMYSERAKPLSPRETGPMRWDSNFMGLDGGAGGRVVNRPRFVARCLLDGPILWVHHAPNHHQSPAYHLSAHRPSSRRQALRRSAKASGLEGARKPVDNQTMRAVFPA